MEQRFVVKCPTCDASYRVRYATLGHEAKCPACGKTFTLAVPDCHDEDEILTWLVGKRPPDATVAGMKIVQSPGQDAAVATRKPPAPDRRSDRLNLYKVDPTRAYFWLAAKLLSEPHVRGSMPQNCAKCLSEKNLNIFLIAWDSEREDRGACDHSAAVAQLSQLPQVPPVELLTYLPGHEGAQTPFDLPFPYYVCQTCSPAGLIRTSVSGDGPDQRCWLSLASLELACRFFAAHRGTNDGEYHTLRIHSELRKKDRWKTLPEPVRSRLSEWFKPLPGERFVHFAADDESPKDRAGSAGFIITDRRLVYHKGPMWRDYPLGESFTISTHQAGGATRIETYSVAHGRAVLKLDSESWANLKHYLSGLEARVKFVG